MLTECNPERLENILCVWHITIIVIILIIWMLHHGVRGAFFWWWVIFDVIFGDFFGWDWGTPSILQKITVLYGCGFGVVYQCHTGIGLLSWLQDFWSQQLLCSVPLHNPSPLPTFDEAPALWGHLLDSAWLHSLLKLFLTFLYGSGRFAYFCRAEWKGD